MLNPNQKFIITSDEETAKKFSDAGFKLISQTNGVFKFINKPPKGFSFSGINSYKYCYTNILGI